MRRSLAQSNTTLNRIPQSFHLLKMGSVTSQFEISRQAPCPSASYEPPSNNSTSRRSSCMVGLRAQQRYEGRCTRLTQAKRPRSAATQNKLRTPPPIHPSIQPASHVYMYPCMRMYINTYIHTYTHTFIHTCAVDPHCQNT